MAFFQTPPALENTFRADRLLRSYLARTVPEDARRVIEPTLDEMGELAAGPLAALAAKDRRSEPQLTHWDAWGHRVDTIELTPLWKEVGKIAAAKGLVATAYERATGVHARTHQFALAYLYEPASGVYTCPLAMTDGAAKTLLTLGNKALIDRAVPRLTSRDPALAWTSGQWMTERTGGSDVGLSETVAKKSPDGDAWLLYGTKWFTSATTSEMTLTLARPEGNPPGGSGLALFYLELRNKDGALNGIQINRLKEKLGTRMVPTAELTLDGARAIPVVGTTDGVKSITPMLSITRTWNAVGAVSGMRHGIALAKDYAKRRYAFGAPLAEKPLHVDTLAGMQAEYEGAFLLTFRGVELLGKDEAGAATDEERQLARLLTPLLKLTTGKQTVACASEALESFGGAGYIEDTGLPRILRDAQVLPIWEGTTNVLSLDVLRALGRAGTLEPIAREVRTRVAKADVSLREPAQAAIDAVAHAEAWLASAREQGIAALEIDARRFALTLGRAVELALLVEHGSWALATTGDARHAAAARRFWKHGVDLLGMATDGTDAKLLAEA
jgi:alkylation response protein AidB-like acyl-CoA dehydrogenase